MKISTFLKSGSAWVLSGIQVAFDGLSSAREIVNFTSSPGAKYAACTASVVEGEIYRKNIVEGFSKFSLLSKKALWEYLIIEKFESDLQINNIREKEVRENLINFFTKIDEYNRGNYQLSEEEKKFFHDCTSGYFSTKNRKEMYVFFEDLNKNRAKDSRFIIDDHIKEFEKINKGYKELIKAKKFNCQFLIDYNANLEYLKQSKSSHENVSHIEQTEKNLKLLRKQLIKAILEKDSCQLLIDSKALSRDLIDELRNEVSEKAKKLWPLRFGMLFSLGVGVCTGVITFYTFPVVLTALGLSLTIASAVIWPLAILAAISYAILIYNTITDLVLNETLSSWWKELNREIDQKYNGQLNILNYICLIIGKSLTQFFGKLINWFKFQEQENYFSYALRMLLSAAVLVFGIITALTTGYTAFIQLQNYVSLTVCVITALPLMLSDLVFILKNSFETVGLLTGISINNLLDPVKKFYQDLKSQITKENYLQCILHILRIPLRLMLSVLKFLIFGFHVFFYAVASDRLFNLSCWLTVFFAAGNELLTDICPLFGNKQGEHHDHDHGGLFNWINKIIFIIPATILGILNWLFSQLNRCTNADRHPLGLRDAIKQDWQQFDIIHKHESPDNGTALNKDSTKLSTQVVLQKNVDSCNKEINRLKQVFFRSDLAMQKINIWEAYKEKLKESAKGDLSSNIILESANKETLARHRFFGKGDTESIQKLNKIEALISANCINDDGRTTKMAM